MSDLADAIATDSQATKASYPVLYYIYSRLDAHVSWDDERLMAELDAWADSGLKAGRSAVTDELRDGIRAEHRDARELYAAVMGGSI